MRRASAARAGAQLRCSLSRRSSCSSRHPHGPFRRGIGSKPTVARCGSRSTTCASLGSTAPASSTGTSRSCRSTTPTRPTTSSRRRATKPRSSARAAKPGAMTGRTTRCGQSLAHCSSGAHAGRTRSTRLTEGEPDDWPVVALRETELTEYRVEISATEYLLGLLGGPARAGCSCPCRSRSADSGLSQAPSTTRPRQSPNLAA